MNQRLRSLDRYLVIINIGLLRNLSINLRAILSYKTLSNLSLVNIQQRYAFLADLPRASGIRK